MGGVAMALAVGLGAFGAHALRKRVDAEALRLWETASRYHFVHALGLFVIDFLVSSESADAHSLLPVAGWLLVAGIVLFSGSLYTMTLVKRRWLGPLTPLGGLAWIGAWVCVAIAAYGSSVA
jgi:uncharacterized membrane protein YgdD (TMEM256/DUF423 family)